MHSKIAYLVLGITGLASSWTRSARPLQGVGLAGRPYKVNHNVISQFILFGDKGNRCVNNCLELLHESEMSHSLDQRSLIHESDVLTITLPCHIPRKM